MDGDLNYKLKSQWYLVFVLTIMQIVAIVKLNISGHFY